MAWQIEVQDEDDGQFKPVSVIWDIVCGYCHSFEIGPGAPPCIQDDEEDARYIAERLQRDQKLPARYVPAAADLTR